MKISCVICRITFLILLLMVVYVHCLYALDDHEFQAKQNQGELLLQNQEFEAAMECFAELYAIDPENETIAYNLVLTYNAYSVELMNTEEYLAAVYYLSKADELSDELVISQNHAAAYFKLGLQQEGHEAYDDAIISLKKAHELDPSLDTARHKLGLLLYNIGAKAYEDHDQAKAREYLGESLNYRSQANAYVYQLLGSIEYFQQNLEKAMEYWNSALLEEDITEEQAEIIQKQLDKINTEKKAEKGLTNYRSDKFIIRYDRASSDATGYKLNSTLRSAYRVVGRYFNHFPKEKVTVIVYNADIFRKETDNSHGGIRAVYDGKIRLPSVDEKTDLTTFKSLLWHEYTHAIVYQLAGKTCPIWLNEGLAQSQENTIVPIKLPYLKKAVRQNKTIPFDMIFSKHDHIPDKIDVALFYQQAYSMTRFLVKRYQLYKIKKILTDLKQNKPFKEAFKDQLYLSPKRFEEKWLTYVEKSV